MTRGEGGKSQHIVGLAKRFFAGFLFASVLVAAGYTGFAQVSAAVGPPRMLMYQGRLLNSNNVPVSDATASMSFALYTAASGGTCLWSNNDSACASVVARTVTLTSGLFSEALGDTGAATPYAAIPATVFSDNSSVYLEVIVNGETLTPRKRMFAAPYAMNSDALDGYNTSLTGATTTVVPVTDANGNLVLTGSPQGSGISQGTMYINPDTGVVAANETLLGVAVSGTLRYSVDGEGDSFLAGDANITGGDIISSASSFNLLTTTVTTLNFASAATTLNIDDAATTKTINIGGVANNGTDTINIATNSTTADAVNIGNSSVLTTLGLTGGTAWSIATNGLITSGSDLALNGGDVSSSSATFNFLDSPGSTTIDIGGVTTDLGNTVNIATNGTTADAISIGNNNATTTLALTGGTSWSIGTNGNIITSGDVAVNGNDMTSTGILRIASGGAAGLSFDSASGIVNVAASDDFTVGSTTLTAPFSVDESSNEVRIGDGVSDVNDPKVTFYASDAVNSGTLSFADTDTFTFANGKLSQTYAFDQSVIGTGGFNNSLLATTVSGTSGAGVVQTIISNGGGMTYSGALGGGSTNTIIGTSGTVDISAVSAVIFKGIGTYGSVFNQSTNATAVNGAGYLAGGNFVVQHDAAQTISLAYGSYSTVSSTNAGGTITNGIAVGGDIVAGNGALTTAYGGKFTNTVDGATRYGLYGEASGGATANYAGYFASARLQVDTDGTPDTPGFANGAGDIFASDGIETDGGARFGDTTGTDDFVFTSAATTTTVAQILVDSLTSGTGLVIQRADDGGAAAFSGKLLELQMQDTSSAIGVGLSVLNQVTGNSVGAYLTQTNVANQTDAAGGTTIGGQALVLETSEVGSNDYIMLIRSNGQLVLAIETDGSVLSDNAYSAAGADYAEYFPSTDSSLAFHEMVCVDSARPLSVKRCQAGETDPFGVMSSDPGFIGNLPRVGETGNVLVGMVGQIDTQVNANEAPIVIGDPITTSSLVAGYGAKARGPARIVGYALEPLSSGTGIIKVLVQPQWYAGDVFTRDGGATKVAGSLAIAALTSATSANTAVNSADLQFRGSVWSGGVATTQAMSLQTTVTAANEYRLSVKNNGGLEVASVNQSGDLALAGKFYPSDRGAMQGSAYIYFDGSAGIGGSFMRTNASGWATGSYDFAEMFPSSDVLRPGEVVVFGDANQQVKRSTGETYSRAIAGIVSTRPGFLAGENRPGTYPIALAGRVPTFVSTENGEISIGDPLTTSSTPGYAMRATEAGPIIGYASESFSGTTGSIVVFVNASYYAGTPVEEGPATVNTISHLAEDIENFDTAGVLNLNGGQLLSIGSMSSASGAWRLDSNGDIVTSGRLIELVESSTGEKIETYAATSREMTVQLSGTIELDRGRAVVRFNEIDPVFTSIIDENPSYRALVTPYGATGSLYVTNRTAEGFEIVESGDATSGVDVDWIVIAYRRDYAPAVRNEALDAPSVSQPVVEVMTDAGEVVSENVVVDPGVSEITDEETTETTGVRESEEILEPSVEESVEVPIQEEVVSEPPSGELASEPAPVSDAGDGGSGASDVGTP